MNIIKVFLLLTVLCFSASCYSAQSTLKWAPLSPADVSNKANQSSQYSSSGPESIQDPFASGALNGYYNMLQGGTVNAYQLQELQKQQTDYAKQQVEYAK